MEKSQVICDTDVIIDYLDHQQPRRLYVKEVLENEVGLDYITLSAISKMELIRGVPNKNSLLSLNKNIHRFNILLINPAITPIALQLIEDYNLSHGLAIPDALIAATTIYADLKLFTFNIRDFRFIRNLELFQPLSKNIL